MIIVHMDKNDLALYHAAPAMLEALEALTMRIDEGNDLHALFTIKDSAPMAKARAAIRAAKGDSR